MRELGIISVATMLDDKGDVTKEKCFLLDKGQLEIIEGASKFHQNPKSEEAKKYRNVILFGAPGTGKTLILAELLKMRVAHYERMKIPCHVIVVVCRRFAEKGELWRDLEQKYFLGMSEIKYLDKVDFVHKSMYNATGSQVNDFLRKLEKKDVGKGDHEPDMKTLVLMDELRLEVEGGRQSCEGLAATKNLNFFIAVSPWGGRGDGRGGSFEAHMPTLPTDPEIMGKQLTGRHRNCREIYELSRHIVDQESYWVGDSNPLKESVDPIKGIQLPEGGMPLWIMRAEDSPNMGELVQKIGDKYIKRGEHATVLCWVSQSMRLAILFNSLHPCHSREFIARHARA